MTVTHWKEGIPDTRVQRVSRSPGPERPRWPYCEPPAPSKATAASSRSDCTAQAAHGYLCPPQPAAHPGPHSPGAGVSPPSAVRPALDHRAPRSGSSNRTVPCVTRRDALAETRDFPATLYQIPMCTSHPSDGESVRRACWKGWAAQAGTCGLRFWEHARFSVLSQSQW